MAGKLNQFRGRLNAEQVAVGINAAFRNAKRLVDDAQLLFDSGRFPSATSLAVLSIEEAGKASILRRLACAADDEEARKAWREYRSHTAKNVQWLLLQLFAAGARRLDDFSQLFDEQSDHPKLLDQVKQIGFYTDCLGSAHWSEPSAVIDEALARGLLEIARVLARDREVMPIEIELWVRHLGPHLAGTKSDAEKALKTWYEEMQFLGLLPAGDNAMAEFTERGIGTGSSSNAES